MKRNKFSLSHTRLLSCDMGELIPCGLIEVLPGDTIQQNTSLLLRCSPLLAPVYHPVDVRIHHWYVPHRLVWADFEKFITGGPDGMDASVFPTINLAGGVPIGSLPDYLGLPNGPAPITSALPFRGYARIWNENYRDQDLQTALVSSTASGPDSTTSIALQNIGWEKDYFTSARPWEQKGPGITIPLGTTAPVATDAAISAVLTVKSTAQGNAQKSIGADTTQAYMASSAGASALYADLTSASAITVNALREALALQRFEEARARYGSRYVEYLRYLGVRSSDARLQRPEYLGGGRQTIQFSEVLQTGPGTSSAVGDIKGHGIAAMRSNRYRRFIEEHGYVFTLLSVRPKSMYYHGIRRHWNRRVKEDFWQKELEHIGQQEVLNKEIYAVGPSPEATFGYQDRYDEYRREESGISGEFKTSTLNFWHFGRGFGSAPALNADFVKCVPTEVPFAVNTTDVLWIYAKHSIQARRLVAPTGSSHIY